MHENGLVAVEDVPLAETNEYLREMEAEAFNELLTRLPAMTRNVFNLFAIDGYAHAEIAQLLSISEGTSKWHVSHARQLLREAIGREARTRPLNTQLR